MLDFQFGWMPGREHLCRLSNVWSDHPVYFLTTCTLGRRRILTAGECAGVLVEAWGSAPERHGWAVGRYVIMPDHVHFFATPFPAAKPLRAFMRDWKKWTSRCLVRPGTPVGPVWQAEFFDHLLRSPRSYSEKWDYVRDNPVRAGLVANPNDWPYSGECVDLSW